MRIDHHAREIVCKVVYCGPGLSGKTTNLHYIYTQAPKQAVGEMVSIDTESERTLHFDLLPLDLGTVHGYRCRFEFYTVPGQSYYAATRRLVIDGADGIVFVVDSRRESMDENIESMNDLNDNIRHHRLPSDIPIVIQYNKQDLPDALSADQLGPLLNHMNHPSFVASAMSGDGVIATMKKITTMVIERVQKYEDLQEAAAHSSQPARIPQAAKLEPAQEPETWLLCCWNCDCMLEVPHARVGDQFQCGQCQALLIVSNPDQGLTRGPQAGGTAAPLQTSPEESSGRRRAGPSPSGKVQLPTPPAPQPLRSPASAANLLNPSGGNLQLPTLSAGIPARDDSGYGMQALPDPSGSALRPMPRTELTPISGQQVLPEEFPLQGFTVISRLDHSLLGTRFRVQDNQNGAIYRALVLSAGLLRQAGYLESLDSYVQMAATIVHPGLVKVYALRRVHAANVILSQDAPDYQPLSAILARRNQMPAGQAVVIVRQVVESLEVASHKGLTHGWIRPEVILVNPDGKVLLDDLGVPKQHAYLLHESIGASAATEHYLAPEHLLGTAPSDVRSDMFMLGAVLFRIITGQGMVPGYSAHEALHKANASGVKTLRDAVPDISRELSKLCSKIAAADRQERFANHRELLQQLQRFGGGSGGTMRLTRSVPATTGSHQRARNSGTVPPRSAAPAPRSSPSNPTAGHSSRATHGSISGNRRSLTSGTGHASRANRHTTLGHETTGRSHPHRQKSNAGVIVIIILLVLGIAGAAISLGGGLNLRTFAPGAGPDDANRTSSPGPTDQRPNRSSAPTPSPAPTGPTGSPMVKSSVPPNASPAGSAPGAAAATPTDDGAAVLAAAEAALRAFEAQPGDRLLQEQARQTVAAVRLTEYKKDFGRLWQRYQNSIQIGGPENQGDAQLQSLISSERFGEAIQRLATIDDAARRENWRRLIDEARRSRRAALNNDAWQARDAAAAEAQLAGPLRSWQIDEDRQWAESVLAAITQKHRDQQQQAAGATAATTSATPTLNDTATTPNGLPVALIRQNAAIDGLLVSGPQHRLDQALQQLDESPPAMAIRDKVALWQQRASVLAAAIQARPMRLRVSTPVDRREQWDVSAVDTQHLTITRASGGSMALPWNDVARTELKQLFLPMTESKDATAAQLATASIACLLAGDFGHASLLARRVREAGQPPAATLEQLLRLAEGEQFVALLDAAERAVEGQNLTALQEVLQQLGKRDGTEATIARYREIMQNLRTGRSASGERLPDTIEFDDQQDRLAFPDRTGTWIISGGKAVNDGDAALRRGDCGNARAATFRFSTSDQRGSVLMDFRGVRCLIDLQAQNLRLDSRSGQTIPQALTVVPHTPYEVHFALSGEQVSLQINQLPPLSIRAGPLSTTLSFAVDTGGSVALDSVRIKRLGEAGQAAAGDLVDRSRQEAVLREALGLDPYGGAYKDSGSAAIILPANGEQSSGVGVRLNDSIIGASFAITGQGPGAKLSIGLGSVDSPTRTSGRFHHLPLPPAGSPAVQVEARWQNGKYTISMRPAEGQPVLLEGDLPRDARHLLVGASGGATLLAPPTLLRR